MMLVSSIILNNCVFVAIFRLELAMEHFSVNKMCRCIGKEPIFDCIVIVSCSTSLGQFLSVDLWIFHNLIRSMDDSNLLNSNQKKCPFIMILWSTEQLYSPDIMNNDFGKQTICNGLNRNGAISATHCEGVKNQCLFFYHVTRACCSVLLMFVSRIMFSK